MCENCLESDYLCRKVYLICIIQVWVTSGKWLQWWNNIIFICTGGWVWFGWQGSLLALSHLIVSVSSFSSKNRNTSLLVFIIREVSAHKVTPTPTFTTNINFAIWEPIVPCFISHLTPHTSQHTPSKYIDQDLYVKQSIKIAFLLNWASYLDIGVRLNSKYDI